VIRLDLMTAVEACQTFFFSNSSTLNKSTSKSSSSPPPRPQRVVK
jgi:hypothetical protein